MKPRTLGFAVESNTFNVKFRPSHSTWKILNGVAGRGHTATAVTPAWVKSMIFFCVPAVRCATAGYLLRTIQVQESSARHAKTQKVNSGTVAASSTLAHLRRHIARNLRGSWPFPAVLLS